MIDTLHWQAATPAHSARFRDELFTRTGRFALGRDAETGQPYLSFPVSNRLVDYDEYYALTEAEYAAFRRDIRAADTFVRQARAHREDDRLIIQPGSDRGTAS